MTGHQTFRLRLKQHERLIGTFVKTPAPQPVEILGNAGFDFVVIDEEHGPFDRMATDVALMAARVSGMAALVRVSGTESFQILPALDSGATGILVPHVSNPEIARDVAKACRYRGGTRGFSASTRAGGYGSASRWDLVQTADEQVAVIAQIEDLEAIDCVDEIAGVEGVDALFVGRGDLTVAMDLASSEAPEMTRVVERIAAAARQAGKPLCVFAANDAEMRMLEQVGASAFVFSTDQGLLRDAARRALAGFRGSPAVAQK